VGSNVFESETGKSFREAGCYVHKFTDGLYASRPGDFLVIHRSIGLIIECKLTDQPVMRLSQWSKNQRAHADEIARAGGAYWLLVNWRTAPGSRKGMASAFSWPTLIAQGDRGSLGPYTEGGLSLVSKAGGWDVFPILHRTRTLFTTAGAAVPAGMLDTSRLEASLRRIPADVRTKMGLDNLEPA
jgi:hypothetical protein